MSKYKKLYLSPVENIKTASESQGKMAELVVWLHNSI